MRNLPRQGLNAILEVMPLVDIQNFEIAISLC